MREMVFAALVVALGAVGALAAVRLAERGTTGLRGDRRRLIAVGLAVLTWVALAVGGVHFLSEDDNLDVTTQNRTGGAWERLFVFCHVTRNPSASDERKARGALQTILNQYAVTPNGRTAFSVSAELRPMRFVLESVAYRVTAEDQCRGLHRTAMRALG